MFGSAASGFAVAGHLVERGERRHQPCAVIRADRGYVHVRQACRRLRRAHSGERLGAVVEGHQRDDRQGGDAAHRLDGIAELVQVVERLDHEQVGAAPLEDLRLVGEQLPTHTRGRGLADRPDRARDEHVPAGHLARITGELDCGRVDPLEFVFEEVLGELAPVRAERVRLDQLGSRVDEGDVERDDGVGRAQVRLLRRPETWHRSGNERAHAAVRDDGGPVLHPLQKSACQRTPFPYPALGLLAVAPVSQRLAGPHRLCHLATRQVGGRARARALSTSLDARRILAG